MMGVIATISIFISIASREKLVWESGPGLELDLDASIQKSSMVALLSPLTSARSPETGAENTFHFYMVTTHKEMG